MSDANLASGYQRNPFNLQNFDVNPIELTRNYTSTPSEGYTPNVANGETIKDYMTFLHELECETGYERVIFTPSEWANGYTLYAFKITDNRIGPGTYGLQSKSGIISMRLLSFAAAVNDNI